jgi:lysophospholipase L1-like esterase
LPPALRLARARLTPRRFKLFCAVSVSAAVLLYLAAAELFAARVHPFDPYLQNPPVPTPADPKPPRAIRLLFLGGSTTECGNLPPADRYPAQVQRLLQERHPDVQVQVLNAGRDWWTSKHSLIAFVTAYRDWRPDVIVVMHTINDLIRSLPSSDYALGAYRPDYANYYGPAIRGARQRSLLGAVAARMWLTWFSELRGRPVDYPLEAYASRVPFERYLRELVRQGRQAGAAVVLVTQPTLLHAQLQPAERAALAMGPGSYVNHGLWQDYPSAASLRRAHEAFTETVRSVAASEGALLADAKPKVPRDLEHFVDEVHYPAGTARILAETVVGRLEEAGTIRAALEARAGR